MRVVAGTHKGRSLTAVPGKATRPTADKVKESIFNMIGPYFEGGWALDLYAGTGGLAIEALSRGMERAVLIDIDQKAVSVIKRNLSALNLEDRAEVYRTDAARAVRALAKRGLSFDAVFLDPPYARQTIERDIISLFTANLLAPRAWIVAEHDASVRLPEQVGQVQLERAANYGDTRVSIYRLEPEGG